VIKLSFWRAAMAKKVIFICLIIFLIIFLYILLKKGPIDSAAYDAPVPPEMKGVLAPNNELKKAELIALGKIYGPEDVAIDKKGSLYSGTLDGKIVRITNGVIETFAETGGRVLGLQFDRSWNLIACDTWKGLLSIDPKGKVTVLATGAEGVPFMFTDDLDIASDGMIYFTDASDKFTQHDYMLDMLEAKPHGRLLSYNPVTKKVNVLLKNLYFANGVALSKNEDFVLINESYRYRITRYWLKGPKTGQHDVFIDNLPGYPDNVSSNRKGTFWLALFTARNSPGDFIHRYPFIKNFIAKLPAFLWAKTHSYGLVLAIDENGKILQSLHDQDGKHLTKITSVNEHDGYLYIGSLTNDRIGRLKLEKKTE
jgi:sugar lactone lactonase YvrE